MGRPQSLLDSFSTCIDNLLKFFEDLQVSLTDAHLPSFTLAEWLPRSLTLDLSAAGGFLT
jgi:hypothetical protein